MADCNVIENYLKEKARMCESYKNCDDCPFDKFHGYHICGAPEAESLHEAIAIVQKWSDDQPQKTLLEDFKEKYPNYYHYYEDNIIPNICPYQLGYEEYGAYEDCPTNNCKECWNRPLNEVVQ